MIDKNLWRNATIEERKTLIEQDRAERKAERLAVQNIIATENDGTFMTADGKTVTVTRGLITGIE